MGTNLVAFASEECGQKGNSPYPQSPFGLVDRLELVRNSALLPRLPAPCDAHRVADWRVHDVPYF
jgi:hypothetical protein